MPQELRTPSDRDVFYAAKLRELGYTQPRPGWPPDPLWASGSVLHQPPRRRRVVYWYSIQSPLHRGGYVSRSCLQCMVCVCVCVCFPLFFLRPCILRMSPPLSFPAPQLSHFALHHPDLLQAPPQPYSLLHASTSAPPCPSGTFVSPPPSTQASTIQRDDVVYWYLIQ